MEIYLLASQSSTMNKKNIDIEEKVKAWAELTCDEHFDVVSYFLFSTTEDRHFILKLLKRAGRDFKNVVVNKTDNEKIPGFYERDGFKIPTIHVFDQN